MRAGSKQHEQRAVGRARSRRSRGTAPERARDPGRAPVRSATGSIASPELHGQGGVADGAGCAGPSPVTRSSAGTHGDARGLEGRAHGAGDGERSRRVAVQAEGVGGERDLGAVAGVTSPSRTMRTALRRGASAESVDHRPRLPARHERAVGLVGAVGEGLGREAKASARPRRRIGRGRGQPRRARDSATPGPRPGRWPGPGPASSAAWL